MGNRVRRQDDSCTFLSQEKEGNGEKGQSESYAFLFLVLFFPPSVVSFLFQDQGLAEENEDEKGKRRKRRKCISLSLPEEEGGDVEEEGREGKRK